MRTKLQQVFKNYGELLAERISNNILTSEDDVRYTFLKIKGTFQKGTDKLLKEPIRIQDLYATNSSYCYR